jgi:hypothetical protein
MEILEEVALVVSSIVVQCRCCVCVVLGSPQRLMKGMAVVGKRHIDDTTLRDSSRV